MALLWLVDFAVPCERGGPHHSGWGAARSRVCPGLAEETGRPCARLRPGGGILLLFLLAGSVVSLGVAAVLTKDFCGPQMAMEGIGAIEAWCRLLSMMNREKGGYAVILGPKVVMAMGPAVIMSIATVIGFAVDSDSCGLDRRGRGARGKAAGPTWNLYSVTIVVVLGSLLGSQFRIFLS